MFKLIDSSLEKEINKALHFVADALSKTGHNSKPVLFHSFKIATHLYQLGYKKDVVIGAVLHDLIEDTAIKYEDIKNVYGENIANIVAAVSFDPNEKDKIKQSKLMFEHALNYGKDAMLVKCADMFDNVDYLNFALNDEMKKYLLVKFDMFITMAFEMLKDEEIYKQLVIKFNKIKG